LSNTPPLEPRFYPLKRLGLFLLDVGLLILFLALTLFFSAAAEYLWPPLIAPTLLIFFFVSIYLFYRRRMKPRQFKLNYDAARFLAARRDAALYPQRTQYARISRRFLLCFPGLCNLLLLIFFPQVTHFVHPRTEDKPGWTVTLVPRLHRIFSSSPEAILHHEVSIPWNWEIVRTIESPDYSYVYTICPDHGAWPTISQIFQSNTNCSISLASESSEAIHRRIGTESSQENLERPIDSISEVNSGGVELTCQHHKYALLPDYWTVVCETSSPLRSRNLQASFHGHSKYLPAFFELLKTVSPAR